MVRQAVENNLDAIHGRLPKAMRPARRRVRAVLKWTGRLGLPVAVVLAASGVVRWPGTHAPQEAVSARAGTDREAERYRAEMSARSQPFPSSVLSLAVRRVIIDAGHGGESLGTSGGGLKEKELTLDIAERMHRLMIVRGFDAVLTRRKDETISLHERAALANASRGDVFVSIHVNSLEPASARGVETYYVGPSDGPEPDAIAARENQHSGYSLSDMRSLLDKIFADARRDESRQLAHAVQDALMRAVRQTDPVMTDRGVKRAPFVVLVATEMPAILAEVSCLSNADEAQRLGTPDYRQAIAEALASGVASFAHRHG